jgi:hypothetical protein
LPPGLEDFLWNTNGIAKIEIIRKKIMQSVVIYFFISTFSHQKPGCGGNAVGCQVGFTARK